MMCGHKDCNLCKIASIKHKVRSIRAELAGKNGQPKKLKKKKKKSDKKKRGLKET